MNLDDVDPTFHPIPGRDGYECNLRGEVRCWRKGGPGSYRRESPKMLAPFVGRGGYLFVNLSVDRVFKKMSIHTCVLTLKSGPRPEGLQCRHLDGNKLNNHPENLCWGTAKENSGDNVRLGACARGDRHGARTKPHRILRGEQVGLARITSRDAADIYLSTETAATLAARYDCSTSLILNIRKDLTWRHVTSSLRANKPAVPRAVHRGYKLNPATIRVGQDVHSAKLSESDVRDVLARLASGERIRVLAAQHGVCPGTIEHIKRGQTWRHLPRPAQAVSP